MCRNIKMLFNFDPPVTEDEVRAASLQFVRKISGFNKPSQANEAAFWERSTRLRGFRMTFSGRWKRMRLPGIGRKRRPRRGPGTRRDFQFEVDPVGAYRSHPTGPPT